MTYFDWSFSPDNHPVCFYMDIDGKPEDQQLLPMILETIEEQFPEDQHIEKQMEQKRLNYVTIFRDHLRLRQITIQLGGIDRGSMFPRKEDAKRVPGLLHVFQSHQSEEWLVSGLFDFHHYLQESPGYFGSIRSKYIPFFVLLRFGDLDENPKNITPTKFRPSVWRIVCRNWMTGLLWSRKTRQTTALFVVVGARHDSDC